MLKFFSYTTLISILVGAGIALETHPSTVADLAAEAPGSERLNRENFALDSNRVDGADLELQDADSSREPSVWGDRNWEQGGAGTGEAGSGGREAVAGDRPQDPAAPAGTLLPVPPAPPAPPRTTPGGANPALIPWGTPLGQTGSGSADSLGPASAPGAPTPQPAEISPSSFGVDPPPSRSLPAVAAAPTPIAPLASLNKPLPVQLSSEAASSRFLSPTVPSEFNPEQPPIPALW